MLLLKLFSAPDDKTRARIIAEAFETLCKLQATQLHQVQIGYRTYRGRT